ALRPLAGAAAEGLAWSRPDLSSYHGAVRERCGSGVPRRAGPRERPPRAWLGRGPIFHPTTAPFGSGVGAVCRGELARGSGRRGPGLVEAQSFILPRRRSGAVWERGAAGGWPGGAAAEGLGWWGPD